MKFYNVSDFVRFNNHYYILKNTKVIEIYSNQFEFIKKIYLEMDFKSFTYNDKDKCFYFSIRNNSNTLYVTSDFKSYKQIKLSINNYEDIKNIYYCEFLNGILITTIKSVFCFDLIDKHINLLFQIKDESVNKYKNEFSMNLIATICYYREIFVVYRVKEINYIAKLKKGNLDEILYETPYFINSAFIIRNELWILIATQYYQKFINTKIRCDNNSPKLFYCSNNSNYPKDCRSPKFFYCSKDCGYLPKSNCNKVCDCLKDCNHLKDCDFKDCEQKKDYNCQIVQSIASVEKSIAKILDSESLKIKAAIENSDKISDLICVNSSVKEVIYYITILEFILTEKLKTSNKNSKKCHKK